MKDNGSEKLRFDGRMAFSDESVSRFSIAGEFRENDFTTLSLEIFWHGEEAERRKGLRAFMGNKMNHVWIPNDDPAAGHVELIGLNGYSTQFAGTLPISTALEFTTLQCGIHRAAEPKDRRLHVVVRLVPSSLMGGAAYEMRYTGEMKVEPLADQPIQVKTRCGELLVSETFNFEHRIEFGNKVVQRIPQTTISGEIIVPQGATLYDVHEQLWEDLEAVRVALCLCCRQSIRIVHVLFTDLDDHRRRSAYCRRKLAANKARVNTEHFISPRNLGNGGLQRLAEAIRASPATADLSRAIDFLATSYENNLETAFFMAFSAMETVINLSLAGPSLGLAEAEWKVIRRATRETLRKVAGDLKVDPADLLEKLPELNRPSFRRRVARACEALQPATADLWPGRDFLDGMAEAANIRNGLFHAAEYSDPNALSDSNPNTSFCRAPGGQIAQMGRRRSLGSPRPRATPSKPSTCSDAQRGSERVRRSEGGMSRLLKSLNCNSPAMEDGRMVNRYVFSSLWSA